MYNGERGAMLETEEMVEDGERDIGVNHGVRAIRTALVARGGNGVGAFV